MRPLTTLANHTLTQMDCNELMIKNSTSSWRLKFSLHACFPEIALLMLGWHFQEGDESRLVFNALHIVDEHSPKKALYLILKLLPALIRVLLIHNDSLTFLIKDVGCSGTIPRSLLSAKQPGCSFFLKQQQIVCQQVKAHRNLGFIFNNSGLH